MLRPLFIRCLLPLTLFFPAQDHTGMKKALRVFPHWFIIIVNRSARLALKLKKSDGLLRYMCS